MELPQAHLSRHFLRAQAQQVAWVPFAAGGPPDEVTGTSTTHKLFAIGAWVEDVQVRGPGAPPASPAHARATRRWPLATLGGTCTTPSPAAALMPRWLPLQQHQLSVLDLVARLAPEGGAVEQVSLERLASWEHPGEVTALQVRPRGPDRP